MSKLFILTLSWNGKDKLKELYPTLKNSALPEHKWLIKDNGSVDGSVDEVNSWKDDNIVCFDYKHNQDNFAKGCNFLFKEAAPQPDDLILLLNNDIALGDTTSIKKMIDIIEADANVGVVGAKLLYKGTNRLQHAGVIFSQRTNNLPYHFRPNEEDDAASSKNREFQAITGAVMLTRAKYYESVCKENPLGLCGLDQTYSWCFEDISACLSIKYEQNKKIVYCGETKIFHEESATLKKNPVNKLFMSANVNKFNKQWKGRYKIDHDDYLNNKNFNIYK